MHRALSPTEGRFIAMQRSVRSWDTSRHGTDIVNARYNLVRPRLSAATDEELRQLGDVGGDAPCLVAGDGGVPPRLAISLDHLVGSGEQQGWHSDAQRCGGLEVDHQIKLLWPLYRQVAWLGSLQDFPDVTAASLEHLA